MDHIKATILALGFLGSFAGLSAAGESLKPLGQATCESDVVILNSNFPGGRVDACEVLSDRHFRVTLTPEDMPPINNSPWYAFQITPKQEKRLVIELEYPEYKHCYWPKVSADGRAWYPIKTEYFEEVEGHNGRLVRISLPPSETSMFIAAQEILTNAAHEVWIDRMAVLPFATKTLVGHSKEGRTIYRLETRTSEREQPEYLFLIGRQHPPEVTGALALMPFAETLLTDTGLARSFRERFNILIVPDLNPDGVSRGHWRHNVGSTDLNRDWGPFKQPEIVLMRDELARFEDDREGKLRFFLDFHSTGRNLFYTQTE